MRIVVKIGTSTLAHPGGRLNIRHTEALVKVWSDIKNAGHELIIVSSGATGLGVGKLQISRPKDMVTKQTSAAATSILSASGSRNFPKLVIMLYFRAILPSSISVMLAIANTRSAHR